MNAWLEKELREQAERLDSIEQRLLLEASEQAKRLGLTLAEYLRRLDNWDLARWQRLAGRYRRARLRQPPAPEPLAPMYATEDGAAGGDGP